MVELMTQEECDDGNKEKEKTQAEPVLDGRKLQTFTRLPGSVDETEPEKIGRIESMLEQICSKLGDEDDNCASYDTMIQTFNGLKTKVEGLSHNLEHEVEYTRTLDEKIRRKNVELDNIQLKKALLEEQGKLTLALEEFQEKMEATLNSITASFTSMDKIITDNCNLMQQKADSIKNLKDEIVDILNNYNKDLDKAAKDQYKLLRNDCRNVLDDCNDRVGEIKTSVLSFLRTCNEQNLELIKKIPEQKRRFCWLDLVVYAMCGVCILGMVVQMVG